MQLKELMAPHNLNLSSVRKFTDSVATVTTLTEQQQLAFSWKHRQLTGLGSVLSVSALCRLQSSLHVVQE